MKDLLQAARLRKPEPHERVNIQIEPFWNKRITDVSNLEITEQVDLAPPIITYTDLIETGDVRNLDTAKRLHEKYIN